MEILDEILTFFEGVEGHEIKVNLEERLRIDSLSRRMLVDSVGPMLRGDKFSKSQVMFVDFPTLRDLYPNDYTDAFYRVCVITMNVEFPEEDPASLLDSIETFKEDNFVDRLVIFSTTAPASGISQRFRKEGIQIVDVRRIKLPRDDVLTNFVIRNGRLDLETIYLNVLCEYFAKRLRKLFHLVLSEIAAPIYDRHYGEGRPATLRIQQKEEEIVAEAIRDLKQRRLAIDVGCGTGRHTLLLGEHFENTIGFDFSPKMVAAAIANRKTRRPTNAVHFEISDVEYDSLKNEEDFSGSVDLVCASFGMGSFVEDTSRLARKFSKWLDINGTAIISFYNSEPAMMRFQPEWRSTALAASVEPEAMALNVALARDASFRIFCRPFDLAVRSEIEKYLTIRRVIHYPTLLSLLPAGVLESPSSVKFFADLDDHLASDLKNEMGYYVTLICSKRAGTGANPIDRIKEEIRSRGVRPRTLEHGVAFTARLAREEILATGDLDESGVLFLKVVIFLVGRHRSHKPIEECEFALVVLPWDQRVDEQALARKIGVSRSKLEGANRETLFKLGFPLGGVSPFGLLHNRVRRFVTSEVMDRTVEKVVIGGGSNVASIIVSSASRQKLFGDFAVLT